MFNGIERNVFISGPTQSIYVSTLYTNLGDEAIVYGINETEVNNFREGTMGYLFHKSPKFYINVFLFVGLTTLETFI